MTDTLNSSKAFHFSPARPVSATAFALDDGSADGFSVADASDATETSSALSSWGQMGAPLGEHAFATAATSATAPAPTLIGAAGGLRFDLIWDASVGALPTATRTAFEGAIETAARYYTQMFANNELINVHIGFGEVDGQSLGSGALGESESYLSSESYATVASDLKKDASWSTQQASADATLTSSDPLGSGNLSVNSAELKTLGLASANGAGLDGYIGLADGAELGAGYSWAYTRASIVSGSDQFDAIGVAEHELSEVMGRVSDVGQSDGLDSYTPLDLFRYSHAGVRDLVANNGTAYFSDNGGGHDLGVYNNVSGDGDLGDWIGSIAGDSYGDGYNGMASPVSGRDLVEMSTLGYHLTAAGLTATSHVA